MRRQHRLNHFKSSIFIARFQKTIFTLIIYLFHVHFGGKIMKNRLFLRLFFFHFECVASLDGVVWASYICAGIFYDKSGREWDEIVSSGWVEWFLINWRQWQQTHKQFIIQLISLFSRFPSFRFISALFFPKWMRSVQLKWKYEDFTWNET